MDTLLILVEKGQRRTHVAQVQRPANVSRHGLQQARGAAWGRVVAHGEHKGPRECFRAVLGRPGEK